MHTADIIDILTVIETQKIANMNKCDKIDTVILSLNIVDIWQMSKVDNYIYIQVKTANIKCPNADDCDDINYSKH